MAKTAKKVAAKTKAPAEAKPSAPAKATTPIASNAPKTSAPAPSSATGSAPAKPSHEAIARLAYTFWEEGGRHDGGADTDWLRAERELLGLGPQQPAR